MSGVRRLPNGNTLITVATDLRIFEVSYDLQEVVWEYNHIPDGQTSISKSFKYSLDYLIIASGILGDSNNDSNIDILDIIFLINFILNNETPSNIQSNQGDMNNDGVISVEDIILLLQIILS